jgi:hypothetical protein
MMSPLYGHFALGNGFWIVALYPGGDERDWPVFTKPAEEKFLAKRAT